MEKTSADLKILSIDIGGSNIKGTILNSKGDLTKQYEKTPTPFPASPENVLNSIKLLVKDFPDYDRISVGFPGYIKNGVVKTAPNLDSASWVVHVFRTDKREFYGMEELWGDAEIKYFQSA